MAGFVFGKKCSRIFFHCRPISKYQLVKMTFIKLTQVPLVIVEIIVNRAMCHVFFLKFH